jgi:cyclophilin family peptidyl-prolyl cis-trans isomerase
MKPLRWLTLLLASLLLFGCGSGSDTPPAVPSIQATNLFYGTTATFYVGVSTLNPGITFSADKCANLAATASSTSTALAYSCKITGTGTLTFTAKNSQGDVLATQAFTVPAPQVQMDTSLGTVVFELNPAKVPLSVDNFLKYVSSGFYTGTIFHRVIANFVVQAGGFTTGLTQMTPPFDPIALESNNGLSNTAGTLAMARTSVPNSATSQFYVNLVDNTNLDYVNESNPGYAVFGKVLSGIDVINAIGAVPTAISNGMSDVPTTEVTVTAMKRLK